MTYNWQLWDNFEQAVQDLGLQLHSQDGGCVYVQVPEVVRRRFYVICWTPLNKLRGVMRDYEPGNILGRWDLRLRDLRQNHADFHLEFDAKDYCDGAGDWFPNLRIGSTPTRREILQALEIMLDVDHFEQYRTMVLLRRGSDD